MPLVAAAVLPHSPLLLPSIAKDHTRLADKTRSAVAEVAHAFHARGVETCIILNPHGPRTTEFVLAGANPVVGNLKEFGDLSSPSYKIQTDLNQQLRDAIDADGLPVSIDDAASVDYGVVVPLQCLALPGSPSIVPISISAAKHESLIRLGRVIQNVAHESDRRIAVIASADGSRRRTPDPSGKPTEVERLLARSITTLHVGELLSHRQHRLCGIGPVATLIAMLEGHGSSAKILATEAPYGVGYIVGLIET